MVVAALQESGAGLGGPMAAPTGKTSVRPGPEFVCRHSRSREAGGGARGWRYSRRLRGEQGFNARRQDFLLLLVLFYVYLIGEQTPGIQYDMQLKGPVSWTEL